MEAERGRERVARPDKGGGEKNRFKIRFSLFSSFFSFLMLFRASALRKETATGLINSGFLSDRGASTTTKLQEGGMGQTFSK